MELDETRDREQSDRVQIPEIRFSSMSGGKRWKKMAVETETRFKKEAGLVSFLFVYEFFDIKI